MQDYQVMPPLTEEEYNELKADIAARGVMVPIEYDEHGNVLDGHHRLQICAELGIRDFPKVIRAGMTEDEKRTHARKLNMARRQLNREQKQGLIREQLRETPEISDRKIATMLGTSHPTVAKQRQSMEESGELEKFTSSIGTDGKERPRQVERKPVTIFNPTRREERAVQNPKVVERMVGTGASAVNAEKQLHREEKSARKAYDAPEALSEDMCRLICADIRNGMKELPDGSVDSIITDPPYPAEYLPLYSDLSAVAARVLKPGGSLIVMSGQSYLPEVIARLSEQMRYHWCLSYLTPGGQSPQLFHKRVNTFWKPVLWFVNGEYAGDYVGDVLRSDVNDNDKRFHEWGQSLSGISDIVDRFTDPGDVVLDPFLGGGTTGVIAVTTGRRFIGSDIEKANIDLTRERIRKAVSECRK